MLWIANPEFNFSLTSQRWNSSVRHNDIESFCFNSGCQVIYSKVPVDYIRCRKDKSLSPGYCRNSVPNTYPLVSRFIRLIAAFERLGPDVWRYWVRALKEGNLEKRINFLDFLLLYLIGRYGCRNINALFTVRVNASGLEFEAFFEDDITKPSVAANPC